LKLPDLNKYRTAFIEQGVGYPLNTVKADAGGLLKCLPPPEKNIEGWPWTEETSPALYSDQLCWPKLTIVTPSYNQGAFIEQTIRSVLLQNYPNLEYIVIDGGSTDNTINILEKYSPWISYWQSKKDNGQSHAINLGFSLASGQYYAWINSDDYYLEGTFYKVAKKFIESRSKFVYGYGLDHILETGEFKKITLPPFLDYLIRLPSLIQPACFWCSSIHQPVWEDLHCALDYELWLRLVKGQRRSLIKEPLCVANVHAEAKTSSPAMKEKWYADHLLICADDAHGAVHNWHKVVLVNRIYKLIGRLTHLY